MLTRSLTPPPPPLSRCRSRSSPPRSPSALPPCSACRWRASPPPSSVSSCGRRRAARCTRQRMAASRHARRLCTTHAPLSARCSCTAPALLLHCSCTAHALRMLCVCTAHACTHGGGRLSYVFNHVRALRIRCRHSPSWARARQRAGSTAARCGTWPRSPMCSPRSPSSCSPPSTSTTSRTSTGSCPSACCAPSCCSRR